MALEGVESEYVMLERFSDPLLAGEMFLAAALRDAKHADNPHIRDHRFVRRMERSIVELHKKQDARPMVKRIRHIAHTLDQHQNPSIQSKGAALHALAGQIVDTSFRMSVAGRIEVR